MKLGLLAKKKKEEEKRLCEKKRGPKASLNKHRRVKIYEFPIIPFNQFTGYYTHTSFHFHYCHHESLVVVVAFVEPTSSFAVFIITILKNNPMCY